MSVLDQIRKLDEQKAQLLETARAEAVAKAQEAIAELNKLGFSYRLAGGNSSGIGKRRTGIRQEVLAKVKASGSITRATLLKDMNADDKSSQQSISNALAALKKAGTITANDGVYKAV